MSGASENNGMKDWLADMVLHYYRQGVLYHHGIVGCISDRLRLYNYQQWYHWGILIHSHYSRHEERFVAEVLSRHGLWSAYQAGGQYDHFCDEEEIANECWTGNIRDYGAIAAEILRRRPNTTWFGTTDPRQRVERFLQEAGRLL